MRFCSASAARSFTFLTLVVLSSHSFTLVNAQSESGSAGGELTSTLSSTPTGVSAPPAPTASPPAPVSHSHSSSEESSPSPSPSPVSDTSSSSQASKSSSVKTTPTATSSSAEESSSSSSESSSAPQSSSSSSSSTAVSSSSVSLSSIQSAGTTLVAQPQNTHFSQYTYTHGTAPTSSSSAAPSESPIEAAAGTSFSHNKGAVAAVATIASLIGVSIVGFIVFKLIKRRARLRDEEEDVYFEKYQEQDPPFHSGGANDSSYNIASATQPASVDAYPDRSMHYGATQPAQDVYADPNQYGMQYPPGTAYAAAAYGAPYQYGGDAGAYGAAPTSPNHPYSHPDNTGRPGMAPRVSPGFGQSGGAVHDEAYAQ